MNAPMRETYIVTTQIQGHSQTKIWNSSKPFTLGYPFAWILERSVNGLRIRNIIAQTKDTPEFSLKEVAFHNGPSNRPLLWQGSIGSSSSSRLLIQIKRPRLISPVLTIQGGRIDFPSSSRARKPEPDFQWFSRALGVSFSALGLLIALSWIWPKPKVRPQDELIPPQFAKILLSPRKNSLKQLPQSLSEANSGTLELFKKIPKKIQSSEVIQAFRTHALQQAMKGLLKGGMTQLLQQSDFIKGVQVRQSTKNIFHTKLKSRSTSLSTFGLSTFDVSTSGVLETSHVNQKTLQIAVMGGNSRSSTVGYQHGERARIRDQGSSFVPVVSADRSASLVEEGLTKDEVGEVIHRHLSEIRYCYESAILKTPDIKGKLVTGFVISQSGQVKSSEVKSSSLEDSHLDGCILKKLVTWQFPKPRGGVDVAVSYPFIFKTLGR